MAYTKSVGLDAFRLHVDRETQETSLRKEIEKLE
jgi:hypothetical protein